MTNLHGQLNPDKVLARPETPRSDRDELITQKAEKISTSELAAELIALYKEIDEETKTLIKTSLATHLDGDFTQKNALKRALVKCVDVLSSEEELKQRGISADRKELLLDKLREDIQNCTPGFFNRVNSVLLALDPPASIEQLLAGFRSRLVEDAFNEDEIRESTDREIHGNNDFYQVANVMGYGVPYTQDVYHGSKSHADIQAALEKTFLKKFTPSQIVNHLLDGAMEDVSSEHQHQNFEFIKMVLKNDGINLGDVFKYDEDGIYQGVNWVKIHSLLYQVLEKEGFFLAIPKENLIEKEIEFQVVLKKSVFKEGKCKEEDFPDKQAIQLTIDKNNVLQAMLTYSFTDSVTYQNRKLYGYLSAEPAQHILCMVPEDHVQAVVREIYETLQKNQALTLEVGMRLIQLSKNQASEDVLRGVVSLINTAEDIGSALNIFTPKQHPRMFEELKVKLSNRIRSVEELREVLKCITPEQCVVVCEAMKTKLLEIVKLVDDFKNVLQCLTPEQCVVICEAMKTKLPEIIKSANDFERVLQGLEPKQRVVVYEAMKTKLPEMIKSANDFRDMLAYLTVGQRTAVYETIKAELPGMIKSVDNLRGVIQYLVPEQHTAVCEAMKIKLPEIVKSPYDFGSVLRFFITPEQCTVVCGAMKRNIELFKTENVVNQTLIILGDRRMLDYSSQHLDNFKTEYSALHKAKSTFGLYNPFSLFRAAPPNYLDKLNGLSNEQAWEKIVEQAKKNDDADLSRALVKAIFESASQSLEQRNAPRR